MGNEAADRAGARGMTFHVGQKIVCVDDDFAGRNMFSRIPSNLPVKNAVYTIRGFVDARGKTFIRLVEILNTPRQISGTAIEEPAFNADRFRPIVSRKTSIGIFTAMLNPSKVGVDA
jgi:hypothetical protein